MSRKQSKAISFFRPWVQSKLAHQGSNPAMQQSSLLILVSDLAFSRLDPWSLFLNELVPNYLISGASDDGAESIYSFNIPQPNFTAMLSYIVDKPGRQYDDNKWSPMNLKEFSNLVSGSAKGTRNSIRKAGHALARAFSRPHCFL